MEVNDDDARVLDSAAHAQRVLHLALHVLHLFGPLLAKAGVVVADDGGVAHQGDQADAEQVGEARAQALHGLTIAARVFQEHLKTTNNKPNLKAGNAGLCWSELDIAAPENVIVYFSPSLCYFQFPKFALSSFVIFSRVHFFSTYVEQYSA